MERKFIREHQQAGIEVTKVKGMGSIRAACTGTKKPRRRRRGELRHIEPGEGGECRARTQWALEGAGSGTPPK